MMEDVVFYHDIISSVGKIGIVNTPLFNYCYNPNSITHSKSNNITIIKNIFKVNKILAVNNRPHDDELALKHAIVVLHFLFQLKLKDMLCIVSDNSFLRMIDKANSVDGLHRKYRCIFSVFLNRNKVSIIILWSLCKIRGLFV